jgi:hypothetical protein
MAAAQCKRAVNFGLSAGLSREDRSQMMLQGDGEPRTPLFMRLRAAVFNVATHACGTRLCSNPCGNTEHREETLHIPPES